MLKVDEITITKYETEFVAKHKDYDVIGVGSNEFEAVLELSKALGALMFSKEAEHEALKKDVARYFELSKNPTSNTNPNEIRPYIEWANELVGLEEQILLKVGKEE